MTVLEMARQYYPRLWSRARIEALVAAGRLTREEAEQVYEAGMADKTVLEGRGHPTPEHGTPGYGGRRVMPRPGALPARPSAGRAAE